MTRVTQRLEGLKVVNFVHYEGSYMKHIVLSYEERTFQRETPYRRPSENTYVSYTTGEDLRLVQFCNLGP